MLSQNNNQNTALIVVKKNQPSGDRKPYWIYRNQIKKSSSSPMSGSLCQVVGEDGSYIGKGYYNERSLIAVRMLAFEEMPIDKEFFYKRIGEALKKRESFCKNTNAFRIVSSEADALPGLIVDVYADTAVFQITTLGMEYFRPFIIDALKHVLQPSFIYEKSDSSGRKREGLEN